MNTPQDDQHYAKAKIVKFLETRGSQDKIGIYTYGKGIRIVQDLTDDPERISRAINRLDPQNANRRTLYTPGALEQSEPELTDRVLEEYTLLTATERVLDIKHGLEAIAGHLAKVPGRKNLIWVTGSLPLVTRTEHVTLDHTSDMQEAARALNDANVALYAVDARGLVGGFGKIWGFNVPGLDTMNTLAGLTGGRAFYVTNGIEDSIRTAVEDSELIYTLGFYPPERSQNGDWHKLRVTVARHGLDVRYREAYLASKGLVDPDQRRTFDQMLHDTLDAAEIGVLAETAPDLGRPGFYNVRVSVDLHDVQLAHQEGRWVGAVAVSLYVEGSKAARTTSSARLSNRESL
jgi:VWFA-related protein